MSTVYAPEIRRDVAQPVGEGQAGNVRVADGSEGSHDKSTPTDDNQIFYLVSTFRQHMDEGKLSGVRWALGHPLHTRTIVRWVRGLPKVAISPADDLAGHVLRKRFGGLGLLQTGRHAQAALVLPANLADFWKGQKRKVFRNKVASAERNGLTWRLLASDEIAGAVQAIFDGRGWKHSMRSEMTAFLEMPLESALGSGSFSPDGSVLSVCLAVASGEAAQIRWGMSVARGSARWAAFAGLLEGAHASGYTTLLVGPMVGAASEDEYFLRRTGFGPHNVSVVADGRHGARIAKRLADSSSLATLLDTGRKWREIIQHL